MKMKITVGLALAVFSIFMLSVLILGFFDKQQKEALLKNQSPANQNQQNNQGVSSNSESQKTFTTSQVAQHSSVSDCWLIINGNVYDVGRFLDLHPGGADVIIPYCGKDATQAFETQGGRRRGAHSQSANQMLADYFLGSVVK